MLDEYVIRKEAGIITRDISNALLCKDQKTRAKLCSKAIQRCKVMAEFYIQAVKNFDELAKKAAEAAIIMREQDEWLAYIDIALGKDKERVYETALKEKEAVERYKNKKENKDGLL